MGIYRMYTGPDNETVNAGVIMSHKGGGNGR